MNIKQKGNDLLLKFSIKKDMRPEWICFTIYYVEKNRYTIKNITTNNEFPPKNLEKHTHTFKLWFSFQKKKLKTKTKYSI